MYWCEMNTNKVTRTPASLPNLAKMRAVLRAGMTSDDFYFALDELTLEQGGLRFRSVSKVVMIPVEEGDELLCFVYDGALQYVEYRGGIFMEA